MNSSGLECEACHVHFNGIKGENRGISLFLPSLSLMVDWRERDRMNASGLECEVCHVHFNGIKGESVCI